MYDPLPVISPTSIVLHQSSGTVNVSGTINFWATESGAGPIPQGFVIFRDHNGGTNFDNHLDTHNNVCSISNTGESCHVTYTAPSTAGPVTITATYSGTLTTSKSTTSITLSVIGDSSGESLPYTYHIQSWIKKPAGEWADGYVSDDVFIKCIQYLIKQKIMKIPQTQTDSAPSQPIPSWIKNNAGWWADGQISDDEFVKGIQYLVQVGIIKV
jgi:hypothetical protein